MKFKIITILILNKIARGNQTIYVQVAANYPTLIILNENLETY